MVNLNDVRMKKMVQLSKVKIGDRVLDLGCGNKKLRKFLPKVHYIGVDIKGKPDIKHNLEKGLPKKIYDEKFNIIFMGEFLEHIENFKSLLKECREILFDEGKIVISVPFACRFNIRESKDHIHSFKITNIKNLASITGFKVTKKSGVFIHIPILGLNIPCSSTLYNDRMVFILEK